MVLSECFLTQKPDLMKFDAQQDGRWQVGGRGRGRALPAGRENNEIEIENWSQVEVDEVHRVMW